MHPTTGFAFLFALATAACSSPAEVGPTEEDQSDLSAGACAAQGDIGPASDEAPRLVLHSKDSGFTVSVDSNASNVVCLAGVATGESVSTDVDGAAQNFLVGPQPGDTSRMVLDALAAAVMKRGTYKASVEDLAGGGAQLTVTRAPGFDGREHSAVVPGSIVVKAGGNNSLLISGQTTTGQWQTSHSVSVKGKQIVVVVDPSSPTFERHSFVFTTFSLELFPKSSQCKVRTGRYHVVIENRAGAILAESNVDLAP